jgi:predicted DNA-binding protein YlxM (UPF0122 family)
VLGEPNAIGSLWGLTSWLPTKEVILDPHDVMTIIEAIQLPPLIRYRSDSLKISPLISNYELSRLLEEIFLTLVKMIPLGVMFDAICNRLGVLTIDEILSLDETIGDENDQTLADVIPSSDIYIEAEVSSKQIAEDIYERLSDRQREILAAQFETGNLTLIEIGERIGVSKSTVSNELVNIGRIIRENQTDLSDIDHVIFLLKAFFIEDQINHKSNQNS